MKEVNTAELIEILEDCGVDVTEKGISTADIDHFLSAEIKYSTDELDPIYSIVCQEVMNQRPDLSCSNTGPVFRLLDGDQTTIEFEIVDAEFNQDGVVDLFIESSRGDASIKIENSGEIFIDSLLERIEQAEEL